MRGARFGNPLVVRVVPDLLLAHLLILLHRSVEVHSKLEVVVHQGFFFRDFTKVNKFSKLSSNCYKNKKISCLRAAGEISVVLETVTTKILHENHVFAIVFQVSSQNSQKIKVKNLPSEILKVKMFTFEGRKKTL